MKSMWRVVLVLCIVLSSCTTQEKRNRDDERRFAANAYANALEREFIEACFDGNRDIVEASLAKGVRVNARYGGSRRYFKNSWPMAGHNWTGLFAAIEHDNFQIAHLLIARGADVRMNDGWGATALHLLADKRTQKTQYDDMVRELINAGSDVNAKTDTYIDGPSGETVLHRAVAWGHLEMVKMLIQAGANVNALTSKGKTPLDYIFFEERNGEAIRKELVNAGAHRGQSD